MLLTKAGFPFLLSYSIVCAWGEYGGARTWGGGGRLHARGGCSHECTCAWGEGGVCVYFFVHLSTDTWVVSTSRPP